MGNWDWKWISVILLLVGGYMLYDTSSKRGLEKTLKERGISTKGYPLQAYERRSRKGGTKYTIEVGFNPKEQGQKKVKLEVSHLLFQRTNVNTVFDVLYLEEDPTQMMIKGEPLATDSEYFFALGMFLVGLLGAIWLGVSYALAFQKSQQSEKFTI